MSTPGKVKPRERLLATAGTLFYAEGIHAVSIDRLCAEAGVSKRSLYQYFANRDEILTEMLTSRGPEIAARTLGSEDDDRAPRERILGVFEQQRGLADTADYRGCPFMNTAIEVKDRQHPAVVLATRFKDDLTGFFTRQARLAGVAEPEPLATQLTMLFDGASAHAVMHGTLPAAARSAAETLLDAALAVAASSA